MTVREAVGGRGGWIAWLKLDGGGLWEEPSVVRGTFYMTTQNALVYVSSLVFYVVLTRVLTQGEVGAVSLLMFSITAVQTVATLSMPMAVAKYVSERNWGSSPPIEITKSALKVLAAFTTPLAILLIAASPAIAEAVDYSAYSLPLAIAIATACVLGYAQLSYAALWGVGIFREMLVAYMGYILVGKALALALAWMGFGVLGVSVGLFVGSFVFLTMGWFFAYRLVLRRLGGSAASFSVKTLLSYSLPLVFSASIMIAQRWADVLVLYALTDDLPSTGIYYLSSSSAWILSMVWNAVALAVFPRASLEWARGNIESLRRILSQTLRLTAFLTLSTGLVGASLASLGMELVYGSGYVAGGYPLALLLVFSIIPAWNSILNYCLRALGKTTAIFKAAVGGVAVELLSVVVLVGPLGMVGAAASRVLMTLTLFAAYYFVIRRYVKPSVDLARMARAFVFAILVAAPAYYVDSLVVAYDLATRFVVDFAAVLISASVAGVLVKPLAREDSDLLVEISPAYAKPVLVRVVPKISS